MSAAKSETPKASRALEELCCTYWYPLYAFVRKQGCSPHDAQDLTQAFFERLIEKNYLDDVAREKGRFRSFLLAALKHFLSNEWDRLRAQKRGGGHVIVSIDDEAEDRYRLEPADDLTPERLYERRWALTLLERVLVQLREEFARQDKSDQFEILKVYLTPSASPPPQAETARKLSMTEDALKVAIHRLRKRYRELVRAEISDTVSSPEEVEDEIRHLFSVFG